MSALEFGEVLDVPISSDPASIMSIIFSERGDAFLSAVRTRQQHCDAGSRFDFLVFCFESSFHLFTMIIFTFIFWVPD
jgi:hypothetical protein